MEFQSYQHIERYKTDEVEEITLGKCYIFYKIDGTNASVWLNKDSKLRAGSRTRELTIEKDNAGFYNWVKDKSNIRDYLNAHPNHKLFGEWLVPHSLKTYRDDAWRRFYVFDIIEEKEDGSFKYLDYDTYKIYLEEFDIDYIPPIAIINFPSEDQLYYLLEKTGQFLVKDGKGNGEGIVIKNYDYHNRYGRQTWAKIVAAEFKERHTKEMGPPELNGAITVESKIISDFCPPSFINKEYDKIRVACDGWKSEYIPRLLSTVYTSLIKEECYNIIKKYKNPIINFKVLNTLVNLEVKKELAELFN